MYASTLYDCICLLSLFKLMRMCATVCGITQASGVLTHTKFTNMLGLRDNFPFRWAVIAASRPRARHTFTWRPHPGQRESWRAERTNDPTVIGIDSSARVAIPPLCFFHGTRSEAIPTDQVWFRCCLSMVGTLMFTLIAS